jgi:hypothetical protein
MDRHAVLNGVFQAGHNKKVISEQILEDKDKGAGVSGRRVGKPGASKGEVGACLGSVSG